MPVAEAHPPFEVPISEVIAGAGNPEKPPVSGVEPVGYEDGQIPSLVELVRHPGKKYTVAELATFVEVHPDVEKETADLVRQVSTVSFIWKVVNDPELAGRAHVEKDDKGRIREFWLEGRQPEAKIEDAPPDEDFAGKVLPAAYVTGALPGEDRIETSTGIAVDGNVKVEREEYDSDKYTARERIWLDWLLEHPGEEAATGMLYGMVEAKSKAAASQALRVFCGKVGEDPQFQGRFMGLGSTTTRRYVMNSIPEEKQAQDDEKISADAERYSPDETALLEVLLANPDREVSNSVLYGLINANTLGSKASILAKFRHKLEQDPMYEGRIERGWTDGQSFYLLASLPKENTVQNLEMIGPGEVPSENLDTELSAVERPEESVDALEESPSEADEVPLKVVLASVAGVLRERIEALLHEESSRAAIKEAEGAGEVSSEHRVPDEQKELSGEAVREADATLSDTDETPGLGHPSEDTANDIEEEGDTQSAGLAMSAVAALLKSRIEQVRSRVPATPVERVVDEEKPGNPVVEQAPPQNVDNSDLSGPEFRIVEDETEESLFFGEEQIPTSELGLAIVRIASRHGKEVPFASLRRLLEDELFENVGLKELCDELDVLGQTFQAAGVQAWVDHFNGQQQRVVGLKASISQTAAA